MPSVRKKRLSILFVCTGNTCRSPMMEDIFRAYCAQHGVNCRVASAGIFAREGAPIHPNSAIVLRERGFPRHRRRAALLTARHLQRFDLVVAATDAHCDRIGDARVQSFGALTGLGDLDDPYGGDLDTYRHCADVITQSCPALFAHLTTLHQHK